MRIRKWGYLTFLGRLSEVRNSQQRPVPSFAMVELLFIFFILQLCSHTGDRVNALYRKSQFKI